MREVECVGADAQAVQLESSFGIGFRLRAGSLHVDTGVRQSDAERVDDGPHDAPPPVSFEDYARVAVSPKHLPRRAGAGGEGHCIEDMFRPTPPVAIDRGGRVAAKYVPPRIPPDLKLTPRRSRLLALCVNRQLDIDLQDSDADLARTLIRAGHWPTFAIPNDLDFVDGKFVPLTTERHFALLLEEVEARDGTPP